MIESRTNYHVNRKCKEVEKECKDGADEIET